MTDYHFRVKASDRVLVRNAFIGINVLQIVDGALVPVDPGASFVTIGPIDDWQNPGTPVKAGGEVLYHYNLRLPFDLAQRIVDLAAQGNTFAQQIIANKARFYSKISNGEGVLADQPKNVWL